MDLHVLEDPYGSCVVHGILLVRFLSYQTVQAVNSACLHIGKPVFSLYHCSSSLKKEPVSS